MKKILSLLLAALLCAAALACTSADTGAPTPSPSAPPSVAEDTDALCEPTPVPTEEPRPQAETDAVLDETLAPLFDMRATADDSVQLALYDYFRNAHYGAEWFDARAAEGVKICVYAARDYGAGTLAVADFYIGGELAPDLYYIEDGAVRSATSGSDCWAINYTRMDGGTIVYGKSFAWDGAPMATTRATAAFSDGTIETVEMKGKKGGDLPGYLFVSPNEVWLDTLTLYDGDTMVADQDSGEFTMTEMRDRFAKNAPLCGWTRFNPMLDAAARERRFLDAASSTMQVALVGDEAAGLLRWYKDSFVAFPDLWRTLNNGLPTSVASDRPVLLDGLNREDASALYWVELALDDGTAAGAENAVQRGGAGLDSRVSGGKDADYLWSTPGAPGHDGLYMLLLDYGDCWYTALFDVERGNG